MRAPPSSRKRSPYGAAGNCATCRTSAPPFQAYALPPSSYPPTSPSSPDNLPSRRSPPSPFLNIPLEDLKTVLTNHTAYRAVGRGVAAALTHDIYAIFVASLLKSTNYHRMELLGPTWSRCSALAAFHGYPPRFPKFRLPPPNPFRLQSAASPLQRPINVASTPTSCLHQLKTRTALPAFLRCIPIIFSPPMLSSAIVSHAAWRSSFLTTRPSSRARADSQTCTRTVAPLQVSVQAVSAKANHMQLPWRRI
ncbi:hypothetical protein B0H11DRAFT_1942741 [Mycena galericulata]|nr:hypothetical protein B0H11DRAFT_1942741 [Mycena galericulata]